MSAVALYGCGGGSGGSNGGGSNTPSVNVPSKPAKSQNFQLAGDINQKATVGQPIGLVATASAQNKLTEPTYQWTVASGNANHVRFSASRQPATAITFTQPGEYVIRLNVREGNRFENAPITDSLMHIITVEPATEEVATLSMDRSGTSGGYVSLYFRTDGVSLNADDWQIEQTTGAQAQIIKSQDASYAQIILPKVTKDEVLAFKATSTKNPNLTDTAYILVRPTGLVTADSTFCDLDSTSASCISKQPLNHHYAYQPTSIYSDRMTECVMSYRVNSEGICHLGYLPFIGQTAPDTTPSISEVPSVDDIMGRVVVTHDWMGKNFEQFLRQKDTQGDFRKLLKSVTAIVISEDINPSFYWGGSGAIYLNADYLWMTPEERDTVTQTVDYRSGYGSDLNYFFDYDYEKNNRSVLFNTDYYPDYSTQTIRSMDTIAMPLASLLYHELAHANDYIGQDRLVSLANEYYQNKAPYEVIPTLIKSDYLASQYPLTNQKLKSLAQVFYGGIAPTLEQKNHTPTQVANWYLADRASDDYGYYDSREDLAMLFEEAMMLTRFGVNRYTMVMDASTARPTVAGGQKNRVANPDIVPRAKRVVSDILPDAEPQVYYALDNIMAKDLCVGTTYFEYYNTDCSTLNLNIPLTNGYRQLSNQGKLDELGRPLGAPRHRTPDLLDPREMK